MTEVEKFRSDAIRILKYSRASSGGYNFEQVYSDLSKLVARTSGIMGALPESCVEYWKRTFIDSSNDIKNEPTEQNLNKLCAIMGFLKGTLEGEELLNDDDWKMLGELVNYEAPDLEIETLQMLMGIIVSKGAL